MRRILPFTSRTEAIHSAIAVALCFALFAPADPAASVLTPQSQSPAAAAETKIPNDQLDSLVAPIALYPDPLLSQILVASTYPLEIVQLDQWMQKNSTMPKEKMAEEVKKQEWDPSVQGLVVLPDVVQNLSENIKWTTDLGNAFLAQQSDVMGAVQRMRAKAKQNGNLKTTEQQKVETKVVESKEIIVIQPAKTEVVYVPSYNPTVVYGAPIYPYPPYPYPPPPPPGAYAATAAISFGVGMMVGAAWHGGYGYHAGWGNNNITINNNNNYVNNSNRQNYQRGNRSQVSQGSGNWQHNPQHRAGAPYSNQATAGKYGGTARGDSMSTRQASARQNQSQMGARQQAGASNRSNVGAQASTMNRGGGSGNQIGNQSVSSGSRGGGSAFGGSGGSSRASATASSSRGSSSMGGSRGGSRRAGGRRR
jgi:hypothetical protein